MLRIQLLGQMAVECDGLVVPAPSARRAWSLLAYLSLARTPLPRAELAAEFWPDVLDSSARASLRSAVWSLRRTLGVGAERYLTIDRNQVGLAEDADIWVDVAVFEEHVAAGRAREAVELCHGELLAGFEDEWALLARGAHRDRLMEVLEGLAAQCEQAGEVDAALEWSRRAAAVDPLSEEAHRALIGRLAASGDRARALVVYRALVERLRRELSVTPPPPRAPSSSGCARTARASVAQSRGDARPPTPLRGARRRPRPRTPRAASHGTRRPPIRSSAVVARPRACTLSGARCATAAAPL